MSDSEDLVQVFVTVAVRTSAGAVPGPKLLPRPEAAALVRDKRAIYGSQPPRGWS
jgi:hypothetical protein